MGIGLRAKNLSDSNLSTCLHVYVRKVSIVDADSNLAENDPISNLSFQFDNVVACTRNKIWSSSKIYQDVFTRASCTWDQSRAAAQL